MRLVLILPFFLATASNASAEDSATLACESVIVSELIAPKTYQRVSSSVVGNSVLISYDAANIYNAPLRNTRECRFAWSESGWTLQKEFSEDRMKLEFAALVQKVQAGAMSQSEAQAKVVEIEREQSALLVKETIREMRARAAGPYPIPQTRTALSQ